MFMKNQTLQVVSRRSRGRATLSYLARDAVVPDQQNNSALISSVTFFKFFFNLLFFLRDKRTARVVDVLSVVLSGAAAFESINERQRAIIRQLK